ncbi:UDP-N-acetylglucosamine 2-epimerase (non-hydrolyzing) [Altererythrobacter sp. ZODW24]|uniref:non-hydrolyzing UDP-N-acetylglucosamine 2-epimerase n=1 Tax=Altererythrobacter sp. ZODW24 TaxID=2185142 RepID=UPI000DF75EE9|nr:UDP-N-acetylglucosamine 2-epimerase (non-hydrolyzing) [Altererythrobacter sp. ZODW24]
MLKVTTVLGTRPEIIRLSRVMAALDAHTDHRIVHTGQNWDYELNEVFFSDLDVRKPDNFLGVDTSSLGAVLGGILVGIEQEFKANRPDAVVVLGDTNSALAAIMARRMKIPIYHMEAGNRSFDRNVPEETNRRLVDHISDFNLVYTEHARRHLLSEGLEHRRTYLTGSPMREVLEYYRPQIDASGVLSELGLEKGKYFIASLHREENVDSSERLAQLVSALNGLAETYDFPVIVSTHPRTRNRLDAIEGLKLDSRIRDLKPFGFHDYNHLQMNAFCAISDSGTIAEESAILDFAAITPRDAIERPEALDTGDIVVTGLDADAIAEAVSLVTKMHGERLAHGGERPGPEDYQITDTSERVVKLIAGTARLSNSWDGIRMHDYI